ncbi:Abi-like protein [Corynebacterium afermentans subsp. afermentans]|uniref:Abi-like protein n=1 Tax=Corynebacterium afermentans TaxID=38286 RepID=A0A9X8R253_9CORY|nr:hypothetical protein [Corynebacterium afermentans]MCG7292343.1 hypothetical protein [Corynebacterium afermentans]WJY57515.1 Abi-like protein [Corynebacterium afermentans subsp. afermentans]SIQ09170.1 hypothetical protein SAMN05421802_10618 [Corynebacterium afermentans]
MDKGFWGTYFGEARLAPFLQLADGNVKLALSFYLWNVQVGAAYFELLGISEVALRNVIYRGVDRYCLSRDVGKWLLAEPAMLPLPLQKLMKGPLLEAQSKAKEAKNRRDQNPAHPRKGFPLQEGDVLAQVTFGAWHNLFPSEWGESKDPVTNNYRTILWESALNCVFQPGADPDRLRWLLYRLTYFRNRIAHHEYLLGPSAHVTATHPLRQRLNDIFELLEIVDPEFKEWATGFNRVSQLLKHPPVR